MESRRRPAAGIGRRHPQCAPIAWHRRPLHKAAALGSIDQACEHGFLHIKTACQFGHIWRTRWTRQLWTGSALTSAGIGQ
jgi:hypothetical protein